MKILGRLLKKTYDNIMRQKDSKRTMQMHIRMILSMPANIY